MGGNHSETSPSLVGRVLCIADADSSGRSSTGLRDRSPRLAAAACLENQDIAHLSASSILSHYNDARCLQQANYYMRQVFISLFGVVPALALCFLILPTMIGALGEYLGTNDAVHLYIILWGTCGIVGAVALFFSVGGPPNLVTMFGLGVGIVGILGSGGLSLEAGVWGLLFWGPTIVAGYLIVEGIAAPLDNDQTYDES